jgi:hypothetical protein
VSKRYLIQVAARNLGLMMRKLFGMGTARSLQGLVGLFLALHLALRTLWNRCSADRIAVAVYIFCSAVSASRPETIRYSLLGAEKLTKSTGC